MSLLHPNKFRLFQITLLECMAGTTGLEPATSAVTGQRSNQTEQRPQLFSSTYVKSKKMPSSAAVYSSSLFHFFHGI